MLIGYTETKKYQNIDKFLCQDLHFFILEDYSKSPISIFWDVFRIDLHSTNFAVFKDLCKCAVFKISLGLLSSFCLCLIISRSCILQKKNIKYLTFTFEKWQISWGSSLLQFCFKAFPSWITDKIIKTNKIVLIVVEEFYEAKQRRPRSSLVILINIDMYEFGF